MDRRFVDGKLARRLDGTFRFECRDPEGHRHKLVVRRPVSCRVDRPFWARHPVAWRRYRAVLRAYFLLLGLAMLAEVGRELLARGANVGVWTFCYLVGGILGVLCIIPAVWNYGVRTESHG